ncbi:hypothetical protein A8H39_00860 [Paraburkholderia fungorum]|uniref:hypothetical protein n=1 Tax=Paraburkholderia fungorum TaxID=134537 RepID=UPI000482A01D|nr:hypothetical protein [Paraburkholderia fungorum]MBB5547406.1 hypothetical protein [Paraburkholderia fungorum]PNE59730.1 hypothetical protein A8H39_00860 [Paraburkholderia fungorum]
MTEITEKMVAPVAMSKVAREGMLFPKARDIWLDHSLLESASDSVAAHLSGALPGRDGPLLRDCLIDAVSAYRATEKQGEMEAFVAYLVALLRRATDVFDLSVEARVVDGVVSWDPLREPLLTFVTRNGDGEITVVRRPTEDGVENDRDESTVLLVARLMPEPIARRVVRHVMAQAKNSGI